MLVLVLLLVSAIIQIANAAAAAGSCPANPGLIVQTCNASAPASLQPTCTPGSYKVRRLRPSLCSTITSKHCNVIEWPADSCSQSPMKRSLTRPSGHGLLHEQRCVLQHSRLRVRAVPGRLLLSADRSDTAGVCLVHGHLSAAGTSVWVRMACHESVIQKMNGYWRIVTAFSTNTRQKNEGQVSAHFLPYSQRNVVTILSSTLLLPRLTIGPRRPRLTASACTRRRASPATAT
jgi:hypothetical protein